MNMRFYKEGQKKQQTVTDKKMTDKGLRPLMHKELVQIYKEAINSPREEQANGIDK